MFFPDAILLHDVELDPQVPGGVADLVDLGVVICNGNHQVNLAQGSVCNERQLEASDDR